MLLNGERGDTPSVGNKFSTSRVILCDRNGERGDTLCRGYIYSALERGGATSPEFSTTIRKHVDL